MNNINENGNEQISGGDFWNVGRRKIQKLRFSLAQNGGSSKSYDVSKSTPSLSHTHTHLVSLSLPHWECVGYMEMILLRSVSQRLRYKYEHFSRRLGKSKEEQPHPQISTSNCWILIDLGWVGWRKVGDLLPLSWNHLPSPEATSVEYKSFTQIVFCS